ncbi:MAG: hypothetical protein KKF48_00640 [Nanoarchaeota archaeon]|nr:hypothetical protein [Nanoarchaeota archaeon]MBU1027530.1 hypothetical protein [Nanoarchaeota archaeon]
MKDESNFTYLQGEWPSCKCGHDRNKNTIECIIKEGNIVFCKKGDGSEINLSDDQKNLLLCRPFKVEFNSVVYNREHHFGDDKVIAVVYRED